MHHGPSIAGGHYTTYVRLDKSDELSADTVDPPFKNTKNTNKLSANGSKQSNHNHKQNSDKPGSGKEEHAKEKWVHCDDSSIYSVPPADVYQQNAYLLFYEKV